MIRYDTDWQSGSGWNGISSTLRLLESGRTGGTDYKLQFTVSKISSIKVGTVKVTHWKREEEFG